VDAAIGFGLTIKIGFGLTIKTGFGLTIKGLSDKNKNESNQQHRRLFKN